MKLLAALMIWAVMLGTAAGGENPPYQPGVRLSGAIRIWGNDAMAGVVKAWEQGFKRYHPSVVFETQLKGSGTGMAGVYTGKADIAFLGRDITGVENMAFAWIYQFSPTSVEVATGSLGTPRQSPALAVVVHPDNPLTKLTLAQLDAMFRAPAEIGNWGDLGLPSAPLHLYSRGVEDGTSAYFRGKVMRNSFKWNWDALTEFEDGPMGDADQAIADAVAKDRHGLGITNTHFAGSKLKILAIAASPDGPFLKPTVETLFNRSYPLTRGVRAYCRSTSDPFVQEFLLYILSAEGQRDIVKAGGYLPLNAELLERQRKIVKD